MLHKTKGIVFHRIKYGEKHFIVHIFTEQFGRVAYAVNFQSKKNNLKPGFFMPLSMLEMEVQHQNNKEIQQINECKSFFPFTNIPFDPVKNVIVLFLAEILFKSIKESENNPFLFDFLYNSISFLDKTPKSPANFHLIFLINLTLHLGIYPNWSNYSSGKSFLDKTNGLCCNTKNATGSFINIENTQKLYELSHTGLENMSGLNFTRTQRNEILNEIIHYLQIHLPGFSHIKSIEILRNLF